MGSILSNIFGSSEIINRGLSMIDDLNYSDAEKADDKNKHKIALMDAYKPFKIAQRYIALMFTFIYLFSYLLVLFMSILEYNIAPIQQTIEMFKISWIEITIITFYFGGGLVNSIRRDSAKV